MKKKFMVAQLKPNILINTMLNEVEKHNKAISKVADILSKLVSNPHQFIIEDKTP